MGIARYVPASIGYTIDIALFFLLLTLLFRSCHRETQLRNVFNEFSMVMFVWLLYCIWEILNPLSVSREAWLISIRSVALYSFLIAVLIPVLFNRYEHLRLILIVWSVLTLLAALYAISQKYIGFNTYELEWLYNRGRKTHVLSTGIRYFSFFTDAANFGTGMGFSMVVFSLIAFYEKNKWMKYYLIFVACLAAYGLIISGTRSALVVPLIGYMSFMILSKRWMTMLKIGILLIAFIGFLKFTYIGHGVAEIRRMRSLFSTEDASLQVRVDNQNLIREYLADKPFGVGLGLGGGKALKFDPGSYIASIPTDSWFVLLWVETGIVGLVLYLLVMLYCLIRGAYICIFRLNNLNLRISLTALLAGVTGVLITSSSNEVIAQFPNGIIIYVSLAFIFMGEVIDRRIANG